MPLYCRKYINKHSFLAVWRIDEELDYLRSKVYLSKEDKEYYRKLRSKKRSKEWLASRLLVQTILGKKLSILYRQGGKPYIKDSEWQISITHKNEFVGVFFSQNNMVAIDIEKISSRIEKVSAYFINKPELAILESANAKFQMHLIWCAKECLIKLSNKKSLIILADINISMITELDKKIVAEIKEESSIIQYTLGYDMLSDTYLIVWVCNKNKI